MDHEYKVGNEVRVVKNGRNGSCHGQEIETIDEIVSVENCTPFDIEGSLSYYNFNEIEPVLDEQQSTAPNGWSSDGNPLIKNLDETYTSVKQLLQLKGGEYSGDEDCLANFRRNAEKLGVPMEVIWAVYVGKHIDAVFQYVKDIQEGKTRERLEPLESRADDIVAYMMHFKQMLKERNT